MKEVRLKDWPHFLKAIEQLDIGPAGRAPFLYRGQARASWDLSPSLLRLFSGSPITSAEALSIETDLLGKFTEQAHLHLPQVQLPRANDLLANWALMQHYGAPTRMLDWTASPYVAAYIAAINHGKENGAIWLIAARAVDSAAQDESLKVADEPNTGLAARLRDPDAPPDIFPIKQRLLTDRAVVQQGWFTVSTQILAKHSEILDGVKPKDAIKLTVPHHLKPTFLRRLRTMNVTANALFPGIDGLGRSIAELASIRAHEAAHQAEGEGQAEPKDAPTDTEGGE